MSAAVIQLPRRASPARISGGPDGAAAEVLPLRPAAVAGPWVREELPSPLCPWRDVRAIAGDVVAGVYADGRWFARPPASRPSRCRRAADADAGRLAADRELAALGVATDGRAIAPRVLPAAEVSPDDREARRARLSLLDAVHDAVDLPGVTAAELLRLADVVRSGGWRVAAAETLDAPAAPVLCLVPRDLG